MKNHCLLWILPVLTVLLGSSLLGCLPAAATSPSTATALPQNSQPIEVISLSGPLTPINPGGPIVEIVLKNVGNESVTSLAATLVVGRSFNFTFDVYGSNPLLSGNTISQKLTMIGGGFSESQDYPLTISGSLQSGAIFSYVKQVQITQPVNK
jgi:hypothetical protein